MYGGLIVKRWMQVNLYRSVTVIKQKEQFSCALKLSPVLSEQKLTAV